MFIDDRALNELLEKSYNEGRSDAIDECIKVVDSVGYMEDIEYIKKLEQLKEQK